MVVTVSSKSVGNSYLNFPTSCCSLLLQMSSFVADVEWRLQVDLTIWMAFCVFNGDLSLSSGWNETVVFAAVVETELLACSSDST